MSIKHVEISNVNGSQLKEQGSSSSKCFQQGNIGHHHAILSLVIEGSGQENKIVMECYLLGKPKVRGYRKHMASLWLNKGMFWVSEQILVDQANIICRNSWITELEIEGLERN